MEGNYAMDYVIDKNGTWSTKSQALEWYRKELDYKQCIIDRLMLEYCPNEMTEEQLKEWASHQKFVDPRLE